jgi:hypothetical protein
VNSGSTAARPTPRDLLLAPVTYDIVIGDFGRDAAIDYVRLIAIRERQLIESILKAHGQEFFDEYRRIMLTVIADVAFFKRGAIAEMARDPGYLTDAILLGIGFTPVSREAVNQLALAVAQEALAALNRGYHRLRIALPCNGLAGLAKEVGTVISSEEDLSRIVESYGISRSDVARIAAVQLTVDTVPEACVNHIGRTHGRGSNLLVLGTRGTNATFGALARNAEINVVSLNKSDYELINRTIVASIGGDATAIAECRRDLETRLVERQRRITPDLVVLEACTDFRLGIGLSSLELFANAMVETAYQEQQPTENPKGRGHSR